MRTFASVFQAFCDRESLTTTEAADRLGIAICTAYRYANGEYAPHPRKAAIMAPILGLPEDDLRLVLEAERDGLRKGA